MGQGIQEWTKQKLWKTAFTNFHKFYLAHSWIPLPIGISGDVLFPFFLQYLATVS